MATKRHALNRAREASGRPVSRTPSPPRARWTAAMRRREALVTRRQEARATRRQEAPATRRQEALRWASCAVTMRLAASATRWLACSLRRRSRACRSHACREFSPRDVMQGGLEARSVAPARGWCVALAVRQGTALSVRRSTAPAAAARGAARAVRKGARGQYGCRRRGPWLSLSLQLVRMRGSMLLPRRGASLQGMAPRACGGGSGRRPRPIAPGPRRLIARRLTRRVSRALW